MELVEIKLLSGEQAEMKQLQHVLEGTPDYFERVTAAPPGKAEAQSLFSVLPEGKAYDDKFVFGIYADGQMVGCIDAVGGYPAPNIGYVGLFLISSGFQGKGIGARAYRQMENFFRDANVIDRLRLAVVATNCVVGPFWEKMGFEKTGEVQPYRYGRITSEVFLLEKSIK